MILRRMYETTIILNAALEDADIDSIIGKVSGYIEGHGGEILETNKFGRRRLAYPINKKYNGYYIHFVFTAAPSAIPVLERFLVLEDAVLRHLTLILPKKMKDYREKRAIEEGIAYSALNPDAPKVQKSNEQKTTRQAKFAAPVEAKPAADENSEPAAKAE